MDQNDAPNLESSEIHDLSEIKRKMHFTGTVIKTSLAGALIDIGLEIPGVVHISQLQEEAVNRVEDVLQPGQTVEVWVRRVVPKKKRLELTMIKPLDMEWREIKEDMIVKGKVVRLEKFGVFVEIGAERPGLVHISEITQGYIKNPREVVQEGDEVEAKVLSVNRRRKQIKLSMKAIEEPPEKILKETEKKQSPKANTSDKEISDLPIPTAMEVAFQEAMERTKENNEVEPKVDNKSKISTNDPEIEQILARTLEHRVRTK